MSLFIPSLSSYLFPYLCPYLFPVYPPIYFPIYSLCIVLFNSRFISFFMFLLISLWCPYLFPYYVPDFFGGVNKDREAPQTRFIWVKVGNWSNVSKGTHHKSTDVMKNVSYGLYRQKHLCLCCTVREQRFSQTPQFSSQEMPKPAREEKEPRMGAACCLLLGYVWIFSMHNSFVLHVFTQVFDVSTRVGRVWVQTVQWEACNQVRGRHVLVTNSEKAMSTRMVSVH